MSQPMDTSVESAESGSSRFRPNLRLEIPNMPSVAGSLNKVKSLFNGRNTREGSSSVAEQPSPKPSGSRMGLSLFSSRGESRRPLTNFRRAGRSPSSTHSVIDPSGSSSDNMQPLPAVEMESRHTNGLPMDTTHISHSRTRTQDTTGNGGADQQENMLLDIMNRMRWRRGRKPAEPADFRGCTSAAFKTKRVQHKACTCMLLGILLAFVLSVYLALTVSNSSAGQEFHILLIMIILILTIFFSHSVIRLCMALLRPRKDDNSMQAMPNIMTNGGYAQPAEPIPVHLARDEELALEELNEDPDKPNVRPPPPAYGLWRGSVRMNPNLLHWQRQETTDASSSEETPRPATSGTNRPPSYASEDGVQYVLEAQPRSTVYDTQMPIHPSERGRLDHIQENES